MRILIADDVPSDLAILKKMLVLEGHDVIAVTDGEEAWVQYKLFKPQLVITDWIMPIMDGLELCKKIRKRSTKEYTYLILLTQLDSRESHELAIDNGLDDFLGKPLNIHELRMRIHVAQRIIDFHNEIETLKKLMPICMYCQKVRDDSDYWVKLETYLHEKQGTDFSHGICPECYEIHIKNKEHPTTQAPASH